MKINEFLEIQDRLLYIRDLGLVYMQEEIEKLLIEIRDMLKETGYWSETQLKKLEREYNEGK